MKALTYLLIFTGIIGLFSCTKTTNPEEKNERQTSNLYVTISPETTKATGSGQGVQADDNTVQTLEIFVFRNEGEDAGMLDAYKKFTGADLTTLAGLEIKTTTGKKSIYAIANSHKNNWTGINTLTAFQAVLADLKTENLKNFTMTGNVDATLQVTTSVTFSISRLVSRIQLGSLKTNFAGTPYAGSTLNNVKVYLLNAAGTKLYATGSDGTSKTILNHKKSVAADINGCAMTGMLYDQLPQNITDAGYITPHYFYCYENILASETAENRFTRLVIQGDLNGHTYYYPININQEGFGYIAANGHKGVKRNTAYSINVTILRPGSLDPDVPVEHGTLNTTLNVLNWVTIPTVSVEF